MTKRPIFFLCILILGSTALFAQKEEISKITITGYVTDTLSGRGIEYPTVALFNDSLRLIKAVAGGVDGKFTIDAPRPGKYILSASMLGYTNSKNELVVEKGSGKIDVGKVYIKEGLQIAEVTVTAVKPLIKNEPDKLTYNIDADPQAANSAVVDILRKVPMLSVDGDDNVRLNGETNFKVLVNGRSSGMMVKNFKDAIKSMPASSIKSVEVITNPPVKYDAEGIGGIINIITNRKPLGGYNGSLNAGANTRGGYNAGGYISAQLGKFALSTNYYQGLFKMKGSILTNESENFVNDEFRFSNSSGGSNSSSQFSSLGVEASYEIDSLNLITLSGWGYVGNSTNTGTTVFSAYNINNILTRKYSNISESVNGFGTGSGVLSYQKTFKKPDQNLTFSYSIDWNPMLTEVTNTIDPELNYSGYEQHSKNNAYGVEHTVQADYYNPVTKKHFFETGLKYILRTNTSDTKVERYDYNLEQWYEDNSRVNDLNYNQHIGSFYGGYVFKHKSMTAKGGFRAEYTLNDGVSVSSDGETPFTNKQFDVVPYVNFSFMLKKGHMISAAFTQRLNRPGIYYLNPYVNDSDPMNISYGNPDLKTVRRNSLNIGWRKSSQKWTLGLNLSGDHTRNNIENIRRVQTSGVTVSTYENIGKNQSARLNVNFSYRAGEKFNVYLNGALSYLNISSQELNLSNEGVSYNGGLGFSLGLWKKATFNMNAYVYGGNITLQSRYPVNYASSIGFSQRFLKDKLTFSINVTEPLTATKTYTFDSVDPTYKMHSRAVTFQRAGNFSLYWRFGKFNATVKKARRTANDDKLSGGGAAATGGTTTP